jgi:hypothetical protein
MLSVIALWSDNVLMLMVDILEWAEVTGPLAPALLANCGAAVTDVLDEDSAELMGLLKEEDEEDDAAEVVILDEMAEELISGGDEAGVLATGWLLVLLVTDDCIDIDGGGEGVPLDDAFDKNAGLKAIENAFAGQAQAQLQAWGGAATAELAAGIELFTDAGTTSITIVDVPPCEWT